MFARNLKKFKLVTFDCTNTLLYFKRPVNHQYIKVAVNMGYKKEDFDENKIMPSFRKHFKEMKANHPNFGRNSIGYKKWWSGVVKSTLADSTKDGKKPQEFEKVAQNLINLYETKECWEKYDGADDIITALKRQEKLIGIISNFDPRIHVLLRDMNLYNTFDFIITSYEANVEKPNRKIFALAIEKSFGVSHNIIYGSEALHIGNELATDNKGANEAGWSSVIISNENLNCKNCFSSLRQFYDILNNKEVNL